MKGKVNKDAYNHLRGTSQFVDDLPVLEGTLHGVIYFSSVAHGRIKSVDYRNALAMDGVIRIFTALDIPGENQIGGIIGDEPLFAENEVHFMGQPIALIIAKSKTIAKKARQLIKCEIEPFPAITSVEEAFENGSFINEPRTFQLGNSESAFAEARYVFTGIAKTNGQEHLYLETQASYAYPIEQNHIKLISSTQGPTLVQKTAAKVLDIGMHLIEVEVLRLGGGFGGKEDQATAWGVMAILAAAKLQKPVKIVLERHDDIRITGKRHPYQSKFKIGLDEHYKIIAFEVSYLQNAGAAADLSPAIAERTLFHATNSYFIPNVKASVYSCKTNLPPNTAFRGFGGPQGMFVIEAAIAKAAFHLDLPAHELQAKNLLNNGDIFPYGQQAENVEIRRTWNQLIQQFQLNKTIEKIDSFNAENSILKKGYALMPVCFGISFTNTAMNHARALVHIYQDGTVGVSTGAVEMGQGVNTKLQEITAQALGITFEHVKIESTNTTRVANSSPSAASSTTDLNGKALLQACEQLKKRLIEFIQKKFNLNKQSGILFDNNLITIPGTSEKMTWRNLIQTAFMARISLSESAHYATPIIHFDKNTEKGHPFAYHVYGTALTEVKLDCLRGIYEIEKVSIVHDFGKSFNEGIDYGQVEGGLMQGIGWMTMEEVSYDQKGRLLSDSLSTYKVPDIFSAPKTVQIQALEDAGHPLAILKSKAVGEPPLMYGIGTYFAIQNAIYQFNRENELPYDAPFTPEKTLLSLYQQKG